MTDESAKITPVPPADSSRGHLGHEEITIVYQPIFDLRTGRAHGFEAFARGPEGTELETFESLYEVAKTAGLVSELDRACCEKAILGATQLPAQCKLFVNTLPFSMHSENFKRKKLMDLFEKGRIVAQQIVWEISEQEPVRDCVVFADVMKERSEIGCQFAIDNLGSGYSGLDKIVFMRPTYIKVAKDMIRDLHTSFVKRQLLSTLQHLAERTEATLVATGIEFPEELQAIQKVGVNLVQGYLLAQPSPAFQTNPSIDL